MTAERNQVAVAALRLMSENTSDREAEQRAVRAAEAQRPVNQPRHNASHDAHDHNDQAAHDQAADQDGVEDQWSALRRQVPDDPVPLRPGELACGICGIPSPTPAAEDQGSLISVDKMGVYSRWAGAYTADRVRCTRCPECASRLELAVSIVAAHRLSHRLGSRAVEVVETALAGLAMVGQQLPAPNCPREEAVALVRSPEEGRPSLAWAGIRFRDLGVDKIKHQCAPRAWACAPPSARERLNKAVASYLRTVVMVGEPDRRLPPPRVEPIGSEIPVQGACLLCGTTTVTATSADLVEWGGPSQAATRLWTRHTWGAARLGGRMRRSTKVTGHTCPPCEDAHEAVGTIGPTLLERACATALERQGRPDRATYIRAGGLPVGWAAVVAEAMQNGEPAPQPPPAPWGFLTGWPDEQPVETDPILQALGTLRAARANGYRFDDDINKAITASGNNQ